MSQILREGSYRDDLVTRARRIRGREFALILFALTFLPPSDTVAQYESLNPRNWFPLEEGNIWRYTSVDGFRDWVIVSTVDTVAFDLEWRRFDLVRYSGPSTGPPDRWYAFSQDDYLLHSFDLVKIDTVIRSSPQSVFRTAMAHDTLATPCMTPDQPIYVSISESRQGNPSDSTNLALYAATVNDWFCDNGYFIYKIGKGPSLFTYLEGAIVNGLEWGNTDALWPILTQETSEIPDDGFRIELYPNPATRFLTIEARVAETGSYELTVASVLGQTMTKTQVFVPANGKAVLNLQLDRYVAGLYFVQLSDGRRTQSSTFKVVR